MSGIDFCCGCNAWQGAGDGTIRNGPDGIEIICSECKAIEDGQAEVQHDVNNGLIKVVE